MTRRSTTLCLLGLFLVSLVLRLVAWRLVPVAQHDNESMGDMYSFVSLGIGLSTGAG